MITSLLTVVNEPSPLYFTTEYRISGVKVCVGSVPAFAFELLPLLLPLEEPFDEPPQLFPDEYLSKLASYGFAPNTSIT